MGIIALALALLIAITIHEFAHALAADKLGDPTPRSQGRLTLDPRAHLDLWGTLMIIFTHIGWGKPVEFDPYNLKNPQRDTAIISLAGPAANLLLATALALFIKILPVDFFFPIAAIVIEINVMLAIFNLVPVHPLDGSKLLVAFLPKHTAYEYDKFMHRYGIFVLLALILPWGGISPVSQLIWPVINFIVNFLI